MFPAATIQNEPYDAPQSTKSFSSAWTVSSKAGEFDNVGGNFIEDTKSFPLPMTLKSASVKR